MNMGTKKKLVSINEDDDSARAIEIIWTDNNYWVFVVNAEPFTAELTLYHVRWNQVSE